MEDCNKLNEKEKIILQVIKDLKKQNRIVSYGDIKEILGDLLYKNSNGKKLSNCKFIESNKNEFFSSPAACFYPQSNYIHFNHEKLLDWCNNQVLISSDYKDNFNYLYFLALLHEISHSKQYLISYDKMDSNSEEIKVLYKTIYDVLINKDSIIPMKNIINLVHKINYKKNENKYLLEINAMKDSINSLVKIGLSDENLSPVILQSFCDYLLIYVINTHYKDKKDIIINPTLKTLKAIGKVKVYNKIDFDNTNFFNRLKFGFPINEEEYEELKNYKNKYNNDPIKLREKIYTLNR